MFVALIVEDGLCSPSVGEFRPAVGLGTPLVPGMVLGTLTRIGRKVQVVAPQSVGGVATSVAGPGDWVEYGTPLVHFGEGGLALSAPVRAASGDEEVPDGVTVLRADTDGTVYLRADPSSPPFTSEGAVVPAQATLALVEVMKTFSPIRAPSAGRVVRVCVEDAVSVESGAPLFWLGPDES